MRTPRSILAFLLASCGLFHLPGCDSHREAAAQTESLKPQARELETGNSSGDPGLSDAIRAHFGAAAWIPEDAALFVSSMRLREQWEAIRSSRAVRKLLELPTVQMMLAQARRHPGYRRFEFQRENDPFVRSIVDLALDAVSGEALLYADSSLADALDAMGEIYSTAFFSGLAESFDQYAGPDTGAVPHQRVAARERALMASVIEATDGLRMPRIVLGFRLAKPKEALKTLGELLAKVRRLIPVDIAQERVGAGTYYVARLDATMIPRERIRKMTNELREGGIPQDSIAKLVGRIMDQTLAICAGFHQDYLLLSVGPDTEHVRRLGAAPSLAAASAMAPLRRQLRVMGSRPGGLEPRMIGLSYLDERFRVPAGKLDVDKVQAAVGDLLRTMPDGAVPDDLPPRLRRDVEALVKDLNESLPEALPVVAASFLNDGLESYQFLAHVPGSWDSTKPLSILSLAGARPLLALACRWPQRGATYDTLEHWVEVAYGYVKEYLIERLEPAEQADFRQFEHVFVVAAREIWETTREYVVPALDGCQALLVVDGKGELAPGPQSRPLRLPRPALVLEVNDPRKLKTAFARYRRSLNDMLRRQAKVDGRRPFEIPAPRSHPQGGGTLYTYPVTQEALGAWGLEPHALLTSRHLVFGLYPSQSASLAENATLPADRNVQLDAPSGVALTVDIEQLLAMAFHDGGILLDRAQSTRSIHPQAAQLVRMHLPVLRDVASTLKSISGRTYREGPLTVRHTWLRVEDLADD